MRVFRFLGTSLLAAAVLTACSDTQPTVPGVVDDATRRALDDASTP